MQLTMTQSDSHLTPAELEMWQLGLAAANLNNILCHCRQCDREWVASTNAACSCGSSDVEHIACWQFPDD